MTAFEFLIFQQSKIKDRALSLPIDKVGWMMIWS